VPDHRLALLVAGLAVAVRPALASEPGPALPAVPAAPPSVLADHQHGFTLTRAADVADGAILAVSLETPVACSEAEGDWLDATVRFIARGERYLALLPVPLGSRGELRLVVRCGPRAARFRIPVHEGVYPESRLTVDPKFGKPPPPRAASEQAAISRAYASGGREPLWRPGFQRPVPGEETSPYGVRRTFNGSIASRHFGLDYDGAVGQPIVAANDGVVVLAGADYYWTGNCVFLDHGNGLFTVYFHMSKLSVQTGQRVTRGQQLGLVGATGRVTGPHLHFGVKLLGVYVDPAALLALPLEGVPAASP
jgi:murein DD-endopeptidase MepM/ murein hydrolase activator NlpD